MKKQIRLVICLYSVLQMALTAAAQDIRNMSPAELEAYKKQILQQQTKQAKQLAGMANISLDEMGLPETKIQLPPKDLRRLATLPKNPPTLIQLSESIRQSKTKLEKMVSPVVQHEVQAITGTLKTEEQHAAAVGAFYAGKPEQAVLVAMNTVLQNPGETMAWNNLASIMTMSGMEDKAIPILMRQLETHPESSMLLNNMGQAYLGLGDIGMAEVFLNLCLATDPYHPEANHSMGMIRFFYKQYEEAMMHFEKEAAMVYRRSSVALLRSKNKNLNIFRLRKNNHRLPGRNYFGELQLGRLQVPGLPETTDQTRLALANARAFLQSATREILYWRDKTNLSDEERVADGKKNPGLYADLVEKLLEDLQVVYPPEELSLFSESDYYHIKTMLDNYGQQMAGLKCPEPPAGISGEMYRAYISQCCTMKKKVMDEFVSQYNAFVSTRINASLPVWKEYINDMINIASLAPNAGNRVMVYKTIEEYFVFLQNAWQSGQFLAPPMECAVQMNPEKADSLVEASHNLSLNCPAWLNVEADFEVVKLKADCDKYAIEGGKLFQAGFERSFKTGMTTLSAGIGVKEKISPLNLSGELKQMAFISFDNNGFNEFGILGKASLKVSDNPVNIGIGKAGGIAGGLEGGYSLGMHSGFKSYVKGTGALAEFVKGRF